MFRIALALVFVSLSLNITRGQLPPETLDKLKRATVYVRIDAGRWTASGSGFLFGKIADQGYIATNSHVIAAARARGGAPIKVVFNSGTKDQQEFTAEVIGDDEVTDLALLSVRSDKLPAFINSAKTIELSETLPVYVLGFPFGEVLATSGRNPAITVSRGEISSIRRTEFDRVVAVQIDGGINPGNSGGPVVTAEGDLVGISVAKVRGTDIGFALPALDLREMLLGRLSTVSFKESSRKDNQVTFTITGEVIDPLRKMQKVELLFALKGPGESKPQPDSGGDWVRISGSVRSVEMKLEGQKFRGEVTLELGKAGDAVYWSQASHTRSDSKLLFYQPGELVVKANPLAAIASRAPRPGTPTTVESSPKTKSASTTPRKNFPLVGIGKPLPSAKQAAADDDPLFGKVEAKPVTTNAALAGTRQPLADAKDIFVTPIQLPAEKMPKTILYDRDGKHAFLATSAGVIHKVSVPELVEVRRLEIGSCGSLAMSKEGLVATHVAKQRLLVIDPDTLTIKKQVHMNRATWVTASPQSSIAFASAGETMSVVNLSRGEIVDLIPGRSLGDRFFDIGSPTMTPDGKYLFVCSRETLHRLAVKGTSLILEETGPSIGGGEQGIEISIDSKYVALPSGSGNHEADGHPPLGIYGTYIYSVEDLQSPRIGIRTGAYPRLICLDPFARLIYAQNIDFQFLVMNIEGAEEGRYNLVRGAGETREIALHPQGKKMLVLLTKSLVWVEIARD